MTTTEMKGGSSASVSSDMHKGLTNKAPKAVDASMKMSGGSVNNDALRNTTAPSPRTIGPRDA